MIEGGTDNMDGCWFIVIDSHRAGDAVIEYGELVFGEIEMNLGVV